MSKEKKGEIPVCRILSCFAVGYTPIIPSPLPLPNTQPAQQHFPSLSLSLSHTHTLHQQPENCPNLLLFQSVSVHNTTEAEREMVCVCVLLVEHVLDIHL